MEQAIVKIRQNLKISRIDRRAMLIAREPPESLK
jgi:hypothetical protein